MKSPYLIICISPYFKRWKNAAIYAEGENLRIGHEWPSAAFKTETF